MEAVAGVLSIIVGFYGLILAILTVYIRTCRWRVKYLPFGEWVSLMTYTAVAGIGSIDLIRVGIRFAWGML